MFINDSVNLKMFAYVIQMILSLTLQILLFAFHFPFSVLFV